MKLELGKNALQNNNTMRASNLFQGKAGIATKGGKPKKVVDFLKGSCYDTVTFSTNVCARIKSNFGHKAHTLFRRFIKSFTAIKANELTISACTKSHISVKLRCKWITPFIMAEEIC
jgi:hypothetical protein